MATLSPAVLTFLLNSVWQVPLMAAAAWIASLILRRNPANHRHIVWTIAMVASFVLPVASIESRAPANAAHLVPSVPQLDTSSFSPARALSAPERTTAPATPPRTLELGRYAAAFLTILWLAFVCCWIARLCVRGLRTSRLRRGSEPLPRSPLLEAVWNRAEAAFGLRDIELRQSTAISGPVMTGLWRKTIILPSLLVNDASEAMLTAAIGHEMAHIARHDFPLSLLTELLWLPLAFQPAAWLICRALARTRELATDELVTRRLIDADSYAQSIVSIARQMTMQRAALTLGIFDGDILEERIRRLAERPRPNLRRARLLLASGTSALAVCALAAAGLAVSAKAQSAATPELRLGVDAFNGGQFSVALDHFQKAVAADPENVRARLFLATAEFQRIRTGSKGPVDMGTSNVYDPVIGQYDQVLARDPLNQSAIFGLATLGGPRRSQQAHDLLIKLIVQDPKNKEAYYSAAVTDWTQVFGAVQVELKKAGLQMGATTRLPDPAARAALLSQYQPRIEEGYRLLQLALNIDPAYSSAMAYMNLLYRTNAEIADTDEQANALIAKADDMVKLTMQTQKAQAARPPAPQPLDIDTEPNPLAVRTFVMAPPPPPPPPPPPVRP